MRLLVTGGAGFIGSNFVRHLLRTYRNIELINLDKLTYAGNQANLADISEDHRYRFIQGDITNASLVNSILETGVDAVVNLAAETHVDRSIYDSDPLLQTNVLGTYCLLRSARKHGVTLFVHISTDEVYGSVPEGESRDEHTALSPSSPYAASKAAADHLAGAYDRTYGVPIVILRSTNNYGPCQYPEKLIPLFVSLALEDRPLPVYGDGKHLRDWMHVRDFCKAITLALEAPGLRGIYNISRGEQITNLNVADAILGHLGKSASLITHIQDRPGHDRRYAIDSSKFRQATGWAPEIAFADGLKETIAWYRANTGWLRSTRSTDFQQYFERNYKRRGETLESN